MLVIGENLIVWWGFISFILVIIAFLVKCIKSSGGCLNRKRALRTELHFKVDQSKDMTWQKYEILALEEFNGRFEVDFPEVFHFTWNSPNTLLEV